MNVNVWCESDQGLLGVERITNIEIELDDGRCDNELSKQVFNKLAELEYFTEEEGWINCIKRDVAKEVGCNVADVEVI